MEVIKVWSKYINFEDGYFDVLWTFAMIESAFGHFEFKKLRYFEMSNNLHNILKGEVRENFIITVKSITTGS